MKEILPFKIWNNGNILIANYLYINCSSDNLIDNAKIYFQLNSKIDNKPGNIVYTGNLELSGEDYNLYINNDYVWNWTAFTLGLTFADDENPGQN